MSSLMIVVIISLNNNLDIFISSRLFLLSFIINSPRFKFLLNIIFVKEINKNGYGGLFSSFKKSKLLSIKSLVVRI